MHELIVSLPASLLGSWQHLCGASAREQGYQRQLQHQRKSNHFSLVGQPALLCWQRAAAACCVWLLLLLLLLLVSCCC